MIQFSIGSNCVALNLSVGDTQPRGDVVVACRSELGLGGLACISLTRFQYGLLAFSARGGFGVVSSGTDVVIAACGERHPAVRTMLRWQ
jgi:hypothetical protein